jgi:ribosomal protein S18 acetylase RimI-like enzyme
MAEVEAHARQANARLMVIYTSSTPPFAPARRLYEAAGFERAAIVADYYRDGDDLFIYRKRLM